MRKEIPLKGVFKDYRLPNILVYLNRQRATGTLRVSTESFTKKLYLISGKVIFASSNCEDDRLGEVLLKAGKIDRQQYDQSVELLKETGKRQGAILVELGYLTPKELFWGVKYQIKEIIYSLFQLQDAEYEFIPDEVPRDEVITLKMGMGNLIYEGLGRIDNWTRIQQEMPSPETVLKLNDNQLGLFQEIELSANDKEVISLINGERTVKDIIDGSSLGPSGALKTLYVLYSFGFLEPLEREEGTSISVDELMQEIDDDEAEFITEVNDIHARLKDLSPHELLNVQHDTGTETLKRNYYRLARRFHPDQYYNSGKEELKQKLTDLFDAITKAYKALKEEPPAEEPIVKAGESEAELSEYQEAVRAEEQYRTGIQEYKDGNYWQAVEAFRWATRLNPKQAKYWSYLSLALTKMPKKLKQAEEALLEALKLEPFNADHYANLGRIYIQAGLKKRAKTHFEKALKFDSTNTKAQRGLKEIE